MCCAGFAWLGWRYGNRGRICEVIMNEYTISFFLRLSPFILQILNGNYKMIVIRGLLNVVSEGWWYVEINSGIHSYHIRRRGRGTRGQFLNTSSEREYFSEPTCGAVWRNWNNNEIKFYKSQGVNNTYEHLIDWRRFPSQNEGYDMTTLNCVVCWGYTVHLNRMGNDNHVFMLNGNYVRYERKNIIHHTLLPLGCWLLLAVG